MAKVKAEVKGMDVIQKEITTVIKSSLKDREVYDIMGAEASDQIRKRTRARQEDYKQPDLKPYTKKRRETLTRQGNSSEFSKPNRSNLTLSGQLLDAISFRVNEARQTLTLFLKEGRKPYKGKKGQNLENKTNKEIMQDLRSRGFDFLIISDKLKALLESKLKAYIRQKLSNYKKIKRTLK